MWQWLAGPSCWKQRQVFPKRNGRRARTVSCKEVSAVQCGAPWPWHRSRRARPPPHRLLQRGRVVCAAALLAAEQCSSSSDLLHGEGGARPRLAPNFPASRRLVSQAGCAHTRTACCCRVQQSRLCAQSRAKRWAGGLHKRAEQQQGRAAAALIQPVSQPWLAPPLSLTAKRWRHCDQVGW